MVRREIYLEAVRLWIMPREAVFAMVEIAGFKAESAVSLFLDNIAARAFFIALRIADIALTFRARRLTACRARF